ncbi:hypothetical protein [Kitasatospora sp. MBT63]|uniref:hypothetical protein n=1 Tax=Kitasatospora sp. MBT63 TaxID=1444768 RepID=UPI0011EA7180|nr:hypothetical protein [Kitasatospora sp. MBT63]
MPPTYNSDSAADPDFYTQLMTERYGPLRLILAERNRPVPPRATWRLPPATPDPRAAEHRAELLAALNDHPHAHPETAA